MKQTFRIAVIGCGAIAGNHITAILKTEQTLCALCDILPEKAEALKQRYELGNLPVYTDYREMIEAVVADAVHICTPHDLHAEMACECLNRGINVYLEKPIAISEEELCRIEEAAKNSTAKVIISTSAPPWVSGKKPSTPHKINMPAHMAFKKLLSRNNMVSSLGNANFSFSIKS